MKNILSFIGAQKIKIGLSILALILIGGVYFLVPGGAGEFTRAYEGYQTVAKAQDVAVFYPSTESNEIRKELFTVLSRTLIGDISDEERLSSARRGIELLRFAERDIDAMADLSPEVAARLSDVRNSDSLFVSQKTRNMISDVSELGERRKTLIEDIRGLSYKANFYTEEIFQRIIADNGALTREHALFLNEQVPLVEEQFDKRSQLYTDLQKTSAEIAGVVGHFDD